MNTQKKSTDSRADGMMNLRSRHALFFRTLACLLIFTFFVYDITWAQGGTPVWQHAKPTLNLTEKQPSQIDIPFKAGKADDIFTGTGDEVIINIQDAHASLSAQHSIVSILETLRAKYNLDVIALEGAEGPIDVSLLRAFPDEAIRKKTAERLMKQGEMSAGEFFSIMS